MGDGIAIPPYATGTFSGAASRSHTQVLSHSAPYAEFIAGTGAACVDVLLTFPINKMIFRQQLLGINTSSALRQLSREGLAYLYRGMLPPMLQKMSARGLMFGMYDQYARFLGCNPADQFSRAHCLAAFLSGTTEAVLSPLERVQVIMQNSAYHRRFRNTAHAFQEIWTSYGAKEFYRGITIILLRNGPSNVIYFAGINQLPHNLPESVCAYSLLRDFLTGSIMGATCSTLTYPLNVVKSRVQTQLGGGFDNPFRIFYVILHERDFSTRNLFRGLQVNIFRSMITWGVTTSACKFIHNQLTDGSDWI